MPNTEYRIAPGDTLAVIAQRYNVAVDVLARTNGISNPNRIWAGQLLKIPQQSLTPLSPPPPPLTHRVSAGETLAKIADRYDLTVEALVQANSLSDPNRIYVGQVLKLQATPGSNGNTPNVTPEKPKQQVTSNLSSGTSPSGNALMEVAFRITGRFEGGKATSYQNQDNGIVSYGKHQATLASGTLGIILAQYVKRSTSAAAQLLAGFMDRVNRKESSLRNDAGFKKALLDAGADPLMSTIQDEIFAKNYWPAAEQGVKSDTLKSPLALAMYYDTNIQGGLASVRTETAKAMKGKGWTEAQYLTEFNRQRDLRLHNLAEGKRKLAEKKSGDEKKQLLRDAEWLESSRSRVTALQSLVAAGDLQLRGDNNGMLHLNGAQVPGLAAGSGSGTTTQQPVVVQPLPKQDASTLVKPAVVSKPSPNFGSRKGTAIDAIIVHHTASNSVESDLKTLTSAAAQVSSHYLLGPDGTLYQLVDDAMRAWHAGESAIRGQKKPDVNSRSIGIEITNDGKGKTPFTEAQYLVLEKLVPYLVRAYNIPMENILGHRDVAPGRKVDPADNFDWSRVRRAVEVANGAKADKLPKDGTTSNVVTPQSKWSLAPPLDDVLKKGASLKEGMQGPAVTELQRLLSLESQDGKFGKDTKNAVKAFHENVGIRTSPGLEGTATKATFDALKNGKGKAQGVNLKEIARNVHDAMEDGYLQTDEQKVYVNLAKLNHDAALLKEFKALYKTTYKVDVVDHIKSEFSNTWAFGNELDRALSYLQPKSSQTKTDSSNKVKEDAPPTGGAKEKSGKDWVSRFLPSNQVSDLKEPFRSGVKSFFAALTAAGIEVDINTTLRPPQRSYLMYYAREIKAGRLAPDKVPAFVPQGGDAPVNIDWAHRDSKGKADLVAAKKAAVEMDKAYNAAGAIGKPYKSNHNGGEAIDVDFSPAWGIGKSVVDGKGKKVTISSKKDLIKVGATFGVYHWNYNGPRDKNDDPHWSKTGN